MQVTSRTLFRLTGATLLIAFGALVYYSRNAPSRTAPGASARGEEVYASHDCTDCHLAAHVLNTRRSRGEPGLIRVRKDWNQLQDFLQSDKRHKSFLMITENDRQDLIAYLKSMQ